MVYLYRLCLAPFLFLLVVYCRLVGGTSDNIDQRVRETCAKITEAIQKGRSSIETTELNIDEILSDAESALEDALRYLNFELEEAESRLDIDEKCLEEKQGRARLIYVAIIEKCRDYSELDSLQNRLTNAEKDITDNFNAAVSRCRKVPCISISVTTCVKNAIAIVESQLKDVNKDVSSTTDKARGDLSHCAYSTARNYIIQINAIRDSLQKCVNASTPLAQITPEIQFRLKQASKDIADAVLRNTDVIRNASLSIDKCISQAITSVENKRNDLENLVEKIKNKPKHGNKDISSCLKDEKAAIAKVNSNTISDCAKCSQLQDVDRQISDLEGLNDIVATAIRSCRKSEREPDRVKICIKEKIQVVEGRIMAITANIKYKANLSIEEACKCAQDQSEYLKRKIHVIRRNLLECTNASSANTDGNNSSDDHENAAKKDGGLTLYAHSTIL